MVAHCQALIFNQDNESLTMTSPYRDAVRHPLNMAMLVLTISAGLVSAWWMLPIGLVLWGIMVRGVASHPVTQVQSGQPQRPVVAQRFQAILEHLEQSQVKVLNEIAKTRRPIRQALDPLESEVNRLVDQAHKVCQRMTPLDSQLRSRSRLDGDLDSQIADVRQQASKVSDPVIRREMEKSAASMQARQDRLQALLAQLEQAEDQLNTVITQLDRAADEVSRIQTLKPDEASPRVVALTTNLHQQFTTLSALKPVSASA